ncbi:MAG: hypothetical protein Q9168_007546 [Polycauliona sp. 1 TL-2023]
MASEETKEQKGKPPKRWLPPAGGIALDSPFFDPLLSHPIIRTALTIDLDPLTPIDRTTAAVRNEAMRTCFSWQRDIEGLFSVLGNRCKSFTAYASMSQDYPDLPTSPQTVGAQNFTREIEHLVVKTEGWYEHLNDLDTTLRTYSAQQQRWSNLQPVNRAFRVPEELLEWRQYWRQLQTRVSGMKWTRRFDKDLCQSIMQDFRNASESFEESNQESTEESGEGSNEESSEGSDEEPTAP